MCEASLLAYGVKNLTYVQINCVIITAIAITTTTTITAIAITTATTITNFHSKEENTCTVVQNNWKNR